ATAACTSCVSSGSVSTSDFDALLELFNLSGITFEIPPHLGERVSSKFLQKSIRQDKRYHRLSRDPRRRHHAPIRPFIRRLNRLLRHHVRRTQRLSPRRDTLQKPG